MRNRSKWPTTASMTWKKPTNKEDNIMKKIDWIRKLTSRKFWLSVASFVSLLIVALGGSENTASQVVALIMAGATVVGYVIGEGLADAGNKEDKNEEV